MGYRDDEYAFFKSDEKISMRYRDMFCDKEGIPNDKAYFSFSISIKEDEDFRLCCMMLDLQKSNLDPEKGYKYGNYILRRFVISLEEQGFFVFRMQGGKFNILFSSDKTETLRKILDAESDDYDCFYGIVDEVFFWKRSNEIIDKGKAIMYQDRDEKLRDAMVIQREEPDSKGNTPVELQETKTKKYRSTMWYSVAHITVTEPQFKEVTVYIFPTMRKKPLESVPLVGVVDDMVQYRHKYGEQGFFFGIAGLEFSVSARFDRQDHLNVAIFNTSHSGKFDIKIDTHEGNCFPATFGKRIGSTREIYPFKVNHTGLYDYIIFDTESKQYGVKDSGTVKMAGKTYEVHMDEECIDLIPVNEEE